MGWIKSSLKRCLDNIDMGNDVIPSEIKVVSFDIFDTLIKRDVNKPEDVFEVVGRANNVPNFKDIRVKAEKKARQLTSNQEISIDEIYECIESISDERKEKIKSDEIKFEIELSKPNYSLYDLYQKCLANYKVILTSDMYLPRMIIEEILKKNNISGFHKLYLSSEINKTKITGDLYSYIIDDLNVKPKEILHIGNSFKVDYIKAKSLGIKCRKISTYQNNLLRKYPNYFDLDVFEYNSLVSFLNNSSNSDNIYEKFGYEVFGPLLYGFISWLHEKLVKDKYEQVLFQSRDGYIMKQMYDSLGYRDDVQDYYIEVSRRSLRVPNYNSDMSYEEYVDSLTVPNMATIVQIFDSFGLEADKYSDIIEKHGYSLNDTLKRDKLKFNDKFKKLFLEIKPYIIKQAENERPAFLEYLKQFDFSKKTAVVDIGWGGSMQMYLCDSLKSLKIENDITGYYVGLSDKSRENLGEKGYKAYGYAFDCLNDEQGKDLKGPFIGLIETLFLELKGSVKNYSYDGPKVSAVRYPFEYENNGTMTEDAKSISFIHESAIQFGKLFSESPLCELLGNNSRLYFNNLYDFGCTPTVENVKIFGWFSYFNCGDKVFLAQPKSIGYYLFHPKRLKKDLYSAQWKVGFLKRLFKIPFSYLWLYEFLLKKAKK